MTGELIQLVAASVLFLGSHLFLSHPPVRNPLRERLGKWGFRSFYSLVSIAFMVWMVMAYGDAPRTDLWNAHTSIRHGSLTIMLFAIFLIICGATTVNPGIMDMQEKGLSNGAVGILKITRHPVMWGIALWGISHALSNGHLEGVIFFGSLSALALVGASHIDYRRTQRFGDKWRDYMAVTSHIPLGAIIKGRVKVEKGEIRWWQTLLSIILFVGLLFGHETLFGPYVLPM
jgi:uncharacterized membrane protein